MAEEDKPKTAFSFGQGMWHFNVMPFGLCNAPSCFKHLMERVLGGLQWKTTIICIDDVIVFGGTFEEELEWLVEVLQRLQKANLKLSPKKSSLFQHEVPFLGHVISQDSVRTDPQKVAVVEKRTVPASVAEVRSFLGLCSIIAVLYKTSPVWRPYSTGSPGKARTSCGTRRARRRSTD